jgi:hypothetical protein
LLLRLPASLWQALLAVAALIVLFARKLVRADVIHLSLAAYVGGILCWAGPPPRFVVVILPMLLFLGWKAVEAITPRRALRYSAVVIVSLVSCSLLAIDIRGISQTVSSGEVSAGAAQSSQWSEQEKVFAWLRTNTKRDAVILANLDPACFLYTGRKATRNLMVSTYSLFYAPDIPANGPAKSLEKLIHAAGASFLVMTPDRSPVEASATRKELAKYLASHPGRLERVDRPGADPEFQIYRIRR